MGPAFRQNEIWPDPIGVTMSYGASHIPIPVSVCKYQFNLLITISYMLYEGVNVTVGRVLNSQICKTDKFAFAFVQTGELVLWINPGEVIILH
jgi:hypothetical protein